MANKQEEEFRIALQANIEAISGSEVFACLYHKSMENFERDPWPVIQLAVAIFLDKPIVLAVLPEREKDIPEKLRKVADHIIVAEMNAIAAGIAAYLEDLK